MWTKPSPYEDAWSALKTNCRKPEAGQPAEKRFCTELIPGIEGRPLRGTGGAAVGDPALILLVFGDFDDPGDLRRNIDGIGARRVRDSDLDVSPLKILLAAPETQAAFGHVFAGNDVVGEARAANGSFVTDLGARVFTAVVQRCGWLTVSR
jgi:hypothetical protein